MTFEEFIDQELYDGIEPSGYFHGDTFDFFNMKAVEFARLKVKEALEAAKKTAMLLAPNFTCDSILNAYPEKLIK